jgi:hypothetical protein
LAKQIAWSRSGFAAKHRTLKTGGDHPRSSGVFQHMGFQPVLLLEKGPKRQSDLSMLIAFGAGREGAGVSQNVAPVLNKFRHAVERMI